MRWAEKARKFVKRVRKPASFVNGIKAIYAISVRPSVNPAQLVSAQIEQVRDFLHVEDAAEAIVAVALSDLSGPVNIGSGQPVTVAALARRLGAILEREDLIDLGALPYAPTDPMVISADTHRLQEGTGWTPRYALDDGLRQTVDWWRRRPGMSEGGWAKAAAPRTAGRPGDR